MRRTSVLAMTAALLPATLAALGACSSPSSSASSSAANAAGNPTSASAGTSATASPQASPTAPATPSGPPAPLLTGTQLKGDLAPYTDFPSGYTSVAQETQNTGDTFEQQSIKPPPTPTCSLFDSNGIVTITGYNPVSFAQGDYEDTSTGGEYAQEIDEFQGTTAQGLMDVLADAALACPTYPDPETNTTATVTPATAAIDGNPALVFTTTDPQWKGGVTIEAVKVGTAVVTVMVSNGTSDNGTPEATQLAGTLVANLAAKTG